MAARIREELRNELEYKEYRSLVAPAGIGGHEDHLLLSDAAIDMKKEFRDLEVILYEDRPYARDWIACAQRVQDLRCRATLRPIYVDVDGLLEDAANLIAIYRSQFDDLNRAHMLAFVREDARMIALQAKQRGEQVTGLFAERYFMVG